MDMTTLVAALILVESGGQPGLINGDAVGILQIRPIFVAEVNRILGAEVYCPNDRTDPNLSVEMAKVWLGYYRGRWEEKFHGHPAYEDMAMIYNRGWVGYCKYVDEPWTRNTDPYWLKVKAEVDRMTKNSP